MREKEKNEILEAIHLFSDNVDRRFESLESDVRVLKTDVGALKTDVAVLKTDVAALKTDVGFLKTAMVTKDYLDDKLAQFKEGLKNSALRATKQISRLVSELHKGGILTPEQVLQIRGE